MKARNSQRSQRGFTLIELLAAMALIVFAMSILSQAFSEGARAFRHLKEIGDLDERLGAACMALAANIAPRAAITRSPKPNPQPWRATSVAAFAE